MHYERKISKISDFLQTQLTHNEIKRDTRKRESFHEFLLWAKLRNEKQKRNSILTKRKAENSNSFKEQGQERKGVWRMPWAHEGEEGRSEQRNAPGSRKQAMIRRYPNGETREARSLPSRDEHIVAARRYAGN